LKPDSVLLPPTAKLRTERFELLDQVDVMLNNLEIIGQFMYPRDGFRCLGELARSGLLNIDAIRTRSFPLDALPAAMEAAGKAGGLECIVVKPS
jgi:alcohol dehydrogenase